MAKGPSEPEKAVAKLVIDRFPQARVAFSVVSQLSPYLPIRSFDGLKEAIKEIEIEGHRLPATMFEKHIKSDLFPIEDIEDLVGKVCTGVTRGLEMARSPSFTIRSSQVHEILNAVDPGRAKRAGIAFISRR